MDDVGELSAPTSEHGSMTLLPKRVAYGDCESIRRRRLVRLDTPQYWNVVIQSRQCVGRLVKEALDAERLTRVDAITGPKKEFPPEFAGTYDDEVVHRSFDFINKAPPVARSFRAPTRTTGATAKR
jgi:hypothetical protein